MRLPLLRRPESVVTLLAGLVSVFVALVPPAAYVYFGVAAQGEVLRTECEINARLVSQMVSVNPQLWKFETDRLMVPLSRRPSDATPEIRRVIDSGGAMVAESADALAAPVLTRQAAVFDAGQAVGRVEISRSLRPVMTTGLAVFAASLLLAVAAFVVLRVLPLRALAAATRDLVAARNAAESAARAKGEFLARMSHEVRTPLVGVLGLARIGQRESVDAQAREGFARIAGSGELLLHIVNDILDYSRIEARKADIEPRAVLLAPCLEQVVELLRSAAAGRGVDLSCSIAPDLPAACRIDPLRLQQVLMNLLANGIKFTDAGSVALEARRAGAELLLRVVDTGVGMDDQQMASLFTPFASTRPHDAHVAGSWGQGGFGSTGLGLAISRSIVELMGGRIDVHSRPGAGSVFEVRLPLVEAAAEEIAAQVPMAGERLVDIRILVAEDNPTNRYVIDKFLVDEGGDVDLAEDGIEALDLLLDDGGHAFDIALLDLRMPGLDGYETARRMRAAYPALPIVALTANAFAGDRERCREAGMNGLVFKPFEADTLVRAILGALGRAAPDAPTAMPTTGATASSAACGAAAVIDWPALDRAYGRKRETIAGLLQTFRSSAAAVPAQLRAAAANGELARIVHLAHSLQGALAFVKAHAAGAAAQQTEQAAQRGDAAAADLALHLADAVEGVLAAAAAYAAAEAAVLVRDSTPPVAP